jgi:hypothetical protein
MSNRYGEEHPGLYSFQQQTMTNEQWYEWFNIKIDVGSAIGVTQQHRVLLNHVAAQLGTTPYDSLSTQEQHDVREKAKERYLSYVLKDNTTNSKTTSKTTSPPVTIATPRINKPPSISWTSIARQLL